MHSNQNLFPCHGLLDQFYRKLYLLDALVSCAANFIENYEGQNGHLSDSLLYAFELFDNDLQTLLDEFPFSNTVNPS